MAVATPNLASDRAAALTATEFAGLMAPLAPFEPSPHLAVAVSGGSDSLALALLATAWARAGGGRVTALTVDHGLRAEAAAEAAQVAEWCARRNIPHATLRWSGPKPRTGVPAAARGARYGLLEEWCRVNGVLHLLTAHQREDQAETLLMRLLRGSGDIGLAAMSAVAERSAMRLLRPLLGMPRARLRATLVAFAQPWIEDPSNRDPAYLRSRLRFDLAPESCGSLDSERLSTAARRFGRERAAFEADLARLLARSVSLDPAGFAWLERAPITAAADEFGLAALAAVILAVSGAEYPPRRERLARLLDHLRGESRVGRSLGGCLILSRRGKLLVCREPAAVAQPVWAAAGARGRWDGRFDVSLGAEADPGLWLGALGEDARPAADGPAGPAKLIPAAARASLPALRDGAGVAAVPALGYLAERWRNAAPDVVRLIFRPTRPLAGAGFRIV